MRPRRAGINRLGDHLRGLRQAADDDGLPVVQANRTLAVGFRDGAAAGLAALDEVAGDSRLARSNLAASVRADLLRRAGRRDEAMQWYREALGRNDSEPGHIYLRRRIAECEVS